MEFTSGTLGLVVAALLAYIILSSMFKYFSAKGPDEIVSNIDGWDYNPKEYAENAAHSALQDCEQSFTGEMDSIGCIFGDSANPAWFSNKLELLSFIESDYLYVTQKYLNRDQKNYSYEAMTVSYEELVITSLEGLQGKDNWGVEDIKRILSKFDSAKKDDFLWFTFKDLCYGGKDIFCFREDFRIFQGGESYDIPIRDDELEEFQAYMLDRPYQFS